MRPRDRRVDLGKFEGQRIVVRIIVNGGAILVHHPGRDISIRRARRNLSPHLFSAKDRETGTRQSPIRIRQPDPATRAQDCVRNRQFMRRRTGVHMGIMQHQVFDMDEFAGNPESAGRIEELSALTKALGNGMPTGSFVQPRDAVFSLDRRRKHGLQH
ncbi:hypothetical protein D3C72_1212800 [compost metagenome]